MNLSSNDNYENDDLITFEVDSKTTNLFYSQLVKYSKYIRDRYLFLDVIKLFPQEINKFKEDYQVSPNSIFIFFELLHDNFDIKENSVLTYEQCADLLKISKYLDIGKLTDQIKEHIKKCSTNVDFIIQILEYENRARNQNVEFEINSEMESLLTDKLDECLSNEKFIALPISMIYRIVMKSSKKVNLSDQIFDVIKKSLSKFFILFSFVELEKLSDDRVGEICELYKNSDEKERQYFSYLKCNLEMISEMRIHKKSIDDQLKEQQDEMNEMKMKITELQNMLKDALKEKMDIDSEKDQIQKKLEEAQKKTNEIEIEKDQIQKQLEDSEKVKKDLQEQLNDELFSIKGQVIACVKSGLLISAQIKLTQSGSSLDTKRSKYIISTSSAKAIGSEAYVRGESITSLEMSTIDFLCKSGTYYVRCLVVNCEGKSKEIVSNSVTTSGECVTFGYKGEPEKISLIGGKYKLEVWGAKGGDMTDTRDSSRKLAKGGLGGYSRGSLKLKDSETVYVYVGGEGKSASSEEGATTSGGFPDGGGTKTGHYSKEYTSAPGTGGGSTSIRVGGETDFSRVIVAGGGGGASGHYIYSDHGGFGGGLCGGSCMQNLDIQIGRGPGTQTGSTGGPGFGSDGRPGEFGRGAAGNYGKESGGGGGGGWYGGGGGGSGKIGDSGCSSGGGGSGWTFTESSFSAWRSGDPSKASKFLLNSSYYLTDSLTVSGDSSFPNPDGSSTECGHPGNGYAKITPE